MMENSIIIYVVQGLGFGDNEDCWENVKAFTEREAARTYILENINEPDDGCESIQYRIDDLELVQS